MDKIGRLVKEKKEKDQDAKSPIRYEFQDFAYRLSVDLDDPKHRSLYFRLAKREKREILQKARDFAIDYPLKKKRGSSKAKIFMWALKTIKEFGRIPTFSSEELKTLNLKVKT